MKRESLMIGDWVYVPHSGSATHYGQVKAIYESCVSVYLGNGSWAGGAEALKPIPLTAEILEKNGFKKAKYGYEWKERIGGYMGQTTSSTTPIEIMYDEGHCVVSNPHIGRMFQGSIDSVHELQHVLRQCDISKDITL